MPHFRKKPVVIEAEQLTWDNWGTVVDFVNQEAFGGGCFLHADGQPVGDREDHGFSHDHSKRLGLLINTLEGQMLASQDDYIIRGVNGEFYPCKPDIFDKTYEVI